MDMGVTAGTGGFDCGSSVNNVIFFKWVLQTQPLGTAASFYLS
jgi:hypothetical protein